MQEKSDSLLPVFAGTGHGMPQLNCRIKKSRFFFETALQLFRQVQTSRRCRFHRW